MFPRMKKIDWKKEHEVAMQIAKDSGMRSAERIMEVQRELRFVQQRLEAMRNSRDCCKKKMDAAHQERKSADMVALTAEQSHTKKDAEIKKLKEQADKDSASSNYYREVCDDYLATLTKKDTQIKKLEEQADQLTRGLTRAVAKFYEEITQKDAQIKELKDQVARGVNLLMAALKVNAKFKDERLRVIQVGERTIDDLESDCHALEKSHAIQGAAIDRLTANCFTLEKMFDEKCVLIAHWQADYQSLEEAHENLARKQESEIDRHMKKKIADYAADLAARDAYAAKLEERIDRIHDEKDQLKAKLTGKEQQIKCLQTSVSAPSETPVADGMRIDGLRLCIKDRDEQVWKLKAKVTELRGISKRNRQRTEAPCDENKDYKANGKRLKVRVNELTRQLIKVIGERDAISRGVIKLSEVIAIWEQLHTRDTGEIGFCDLDRAIDQAVGVHNDLGNCQSRLPGPEAAR